MQRFCDTETDRHRQLLRVSGSSPSRYAARPSQGMMMAVRKEKGKRKKKKVEGEEKTRK